MTKKLIALGLICLLAGLAFSADLYKQRTYPETRGDRFWQSSSAATFLSVTATNRDTLLSAGTARSLAFVTTTNAAEWIGGDYGSQLIIPANELYLCGTVDMFSAVGDYDDSLIVKYWAISQADGDSGIFFGADTIALDTTGMNIDEGEVMFFINELTPTDKKGNVFIPNKMQISATVISLDGGDTLFVDDCQVLMRWTN